MVGCEPSGDRVAMCWTEFDHYGSEAGRRQHTDFVQHHWPQGQEVE